MTPQDTEKEVDSISVDAKFNALRKEIEYRSQAQLALISLNITAAGIIGGLVMKGGDNSSSDSYLILSALISPALGMLWLDHALTIDRLGDRCRRMGFGWERSVHKERYQLTHRMLFCLQILLLFGGPGVVSLYRLYSYLNLHPFTFPRGLMEWGWNAGLLWLTAYGLFFLPFAFGRGVMKLLRDIGRRVQKFKRSRQRVALQPGAMAVHVAPLEGSATDDGEPTQSALDPHHRLEQ